MKKIFLFALGAITFLSLSSCNDEWKDELYAQMVSFKAPRGVNGVYDIYMRYNADGTGQYQLPLIVSGTTPNSTGLDVNIGVDNDTLAILNKAQFAVGRNDLWFRQLPEQFYTFASPTCHIPAGSNSENYTINFNLKGLDLNEKWVLPLTIEPSNSYVQNIRKGWYKALLNINLFNDYSGRYSATNMNIYIDGTTNDPAVEDSRTARVVDDKSVFFYAGTVWEEDVNRSKYKVIVTFGEGTKDADGNITGPITITAGDPSNEVNIEQSGACTYTYRVTKHPTKPYIERRITTMYLDYKYSDITSDPSNPIRFHCQGNMTMERQYNTNIPDEEQAISW